MADTTTQTSGQTTPAPPATNTIAMAIGSAISTASQLQGFGENPMSLIAKGF